MLKGHSLDSFLIRNKLIFLQNGKVQFLQVFSFSLTHTNINDSAFLFWKKKFSANSCDAWKYDSEINGNVSISKAKWIKLKIKAVTEY